MLQRYLGNKTSLTGEIVRLTRELAAPGAHVCDVFAGSIAVSVALRKAGFQVSSNDINILSWIYGVTYLSNCRLPDLSLPEILGRAGAKALKLHRTELAQETNRSLEFLDQNQQDIQLIHDWSLIIETIFSPYSTREFKQKEIRSDFFDHYCESGSKSAFVSGRGSVGRRRYLSAENAAALDRAMTRVRIWYRTGRISDKARCLLTSCILDAVEKVSNIQGTYHDFPRNFYDPRALKSISASLPSLSELLAGPEACHVGKGQDSLDFVKGVSAHSVLYLDPPYNFRQYTAYYFLPNLIAEYPEIEDLDQYFSDIKYVRGQNMSSDFTSTFCSASAFLPSLQQLIQDAKCEYVMLSYFNGKNHWHDFKSGTDDRGRRELENFFSSDLFERGSLDFYPIDRLNYQSYGGHKALQVSEYLFVAKKVTSKPMNARAEKENADAVV